MRRAPPRTSRRYLIERFTRRNQHPEVDIVLAQVDAGGSRLAKGRRWDHRVVDVPLFEGFEEREGVELTAVTADRCPADARHNRAHVEAIGPRGRCGDQVNVVGPQVDYVLGVRVQFDRTAVRTQYALRRPSRPRGVRESERIVWMRLDGVEGVVVFSNSVVVVDGRGSVDGPTVDRDDSIEG